MQAPRSWSSVEAAPSSRSWKGAEAALLEHLD